MTPPRPDMRRKVEQTYQTHMMPWWEALRKHRAELVDAERRLRDAERAFDREVARFLTNQVKGAVIASLGPTVGTIFAVWGISKAIFTLVAKPPAGATAAVQGTSLAAKTAKMFEGDVGQLGGAGDRLLGHLSALVQAGRAASAVRQVKDYQAKTAALLREVERVTRSGGVGAQFDARA
jgi:hypothetical protein